MRVGARWIGTQWLVGLCLFVPSGALSAQTGSNGRTEPRVVGVDENGWPVFENPTAERPRPRALNSGRTAEARDGATGIAAVSAPEPRPAPLDSSIEHPLPLTSPLHDVFRRVGQPADLHDLRGVVAWYRFTIRDHRGATLGEREITHEADLPAPARDRLLLPGRKIYGRDGGAVFAELHRLPMPGYEVEAAQELELFGLLLRLPWAFADENRFRVLGHDFAEVDGERHVRIEVERTTDPIVDATTGVERFDRFWLYCDRDTHDPIELRYRLAATGATRRIALSHYQRVGAVRLPMHRAVLDDGGTSTVEWTIARVDAGQDFPRAQFRPVGR